MRTITNVVLHRESGISPSAVILQHRKEPAAARIQRLDAWHLLVFRSREVPKDTTSRLGLRIGQKNQTFKFLERYLTRLHISAKNVPLAERPGKLYFPKAESITKITGGDF